MGFSHDGALMVRLGIVIHRHEEKGLDKRFSHHPDAHGGGVRWFS
jgi:hypothetical protein